MENKKLPSSFTKKFPIWLSYGLILLLIFLTIAILDFILNCQLGDNFGEGCGFFLVFISFPVMPLAWNFSGPFFYIITVILSAIMYFAVGALIGLITSKITEKK